MRPLLRRSGYGFASSSSLVTKPNSENKDKKCLEILIDELTGNVGNRAKVDPSEKVVDHVQLLLFLFVVGVFCWGS